MRHLFCDFLEKKDFLTTWKEIPVENEVQKTMTTMMIDIETIKERLEKNNVFTIAQRPVTVDGMPQVSVAHALADLPVPVAMRFP